jgi:hypothetical protein
MTATIEELLPRFLDPDCGRCKEPLPEPGQPCPGCGAVPEHTRAEVEERLAEPGAIAVIEARDLRVAACQLVDQIRGLLRAADMVEHVASLERQRDEIAALLSAARSAEATCDKELQQAQRTEEGARAAVEDSLGNYTAHSDAWDAATKTKPKPSARERTRLLADLNAAGPILEADQAALRAAEQDREAAERKLAGATQAVSELKDRRDAAKKAVANPGRPAKSGITLTLDLSYQAQETDLTEDEQAQVRSLGAAIASLSGAGEMIASLAVELHEKAKATEYRNQPLYTRPLGPGNLEAVANPATAGRPLS